MFTNVVSIRPSEHLYRKVLDAIPLVRAMAGMRAISAGGRALVVAGAALLLGSLFVLPWFEVSGTRPDLPAGRYGGVGGDGHLESLRAGAGGWVALPLVPGVGALSRWVPGE